MPTTRRGFLGILGALAASRLGTWECEQTPQRFVLHECYIAGFRYHEGPDLIRYLQVDEELQLVPEPGNPYDQWAVRIEYRKSHIGYLPRRQNQPIARLLQQGVPVRCRITRVDPDAVPWEAVRVQAAITADEVSKGVSHA